MFRMRWDKGEGWVERRCDHCGGTYAATRWRVLAGRTQFCGKTCADAARRGQARPSFASLDELVHLYRDEGLSSTVIAARYGVTPQAVLFHLRKAGIAFRGPPMDGAHLQTPAARAATRAAHPRGTGHPGFKDVPTDEIVRAYEQGETPAILARAYGVSASVIYDRLHTAGVAVRQSGFEQRRNTTATDGDKVHSRWEGIVDDWLSTNGIPHIAHPVLPWKGNGRRRPEADFLAKGHYVEIWGVEHSARYAAARLTKIEKYAEYGLPLIELWPRQIVAGDLGALEVLR